MTSIGRRCRGGNVYSRAILITRTLSGKQFPQKIRSRGKTTPPRLPERTDTAGSELKKEIRKKESFQASTQVRPMSDHLTAIEPKDNRPVKKDSGGDSERVPPLPIPNREVKPFHADDTTKVGK